MLESDAELVQHFLGAHGSSIQRMWRENKRMARQLSLVADVFGRTLPVDGIDIAIAPDFHCNCRAPSMQG